MRAGERHCAGFGKGGEGQSTDSKALIVFGRAGRRTDESSLGKRPGSFSSEQIPPCHYMHLTVTDQQVR